MSDQVKVRFSKHFSSPVYGNVWPGREVTVSLKQARRLAFNDLIETEAQKPTRGRPSRTKKAVNRVPKDSE